MLSTLKTMASLRSNQPEQVKLDIEAVFERVYKMLEESEVEPNFAIQFANDAISNDAANEITLEDILSLDEDWLYYDNDSNQQEDFTNGSDGEAVQEYYAGSYSSLEYEDITESIPDEMANFYDNYDSEGSEPIHEYHIVHQKSVWVSETGEHFYAYSNPKDEPIVEQFICDVCHSNYCDHYIHQRFHEIAEELMNESPVTCSMCNAAYTNKEQHLRFHEIASFYAMNNLFG